MRLSYVLPRLILLVLVWAFSAFAFDPILRWGMIKGIQKSTRAKAEISSVKTTFFPPSLRVKGVAVADPDNEFSNLLEFSELSFAAVGAALLEKKLVVEEGSLKGLRLGTPRGTSGRLAAKKKEKPSTLAARMQEETASFAVDVAAEGAGSASKNVTAEMKTQYEVKAEDLESVKLAKRLEEQYKKDYEEISARFDDKKYQDALDAIKARADKARKQKNFLKQAREYSKIGKEVKKLNAQFRADKKATEEALDRAKDGFKELEEARRRDQAAVMAKMKLPSMDPGSLARMLAGKAAAEKADRALKFVEMAKKYMPSGAKGVLKNEAPRGRAVHFPKEKTYPSLLVRKLQLTGEMGVEDPLDYSGTIEGITNQPAVYGKPAVAVIKGAKDARRLDFKAVIDARGDELKTVSRLSYTGMPVNKMQLGSPGSLLVDITGGTGSIQADLETEGDKLDGKAAAKLAGATFSPQSGSLKGPMKSAVESSFAGISSAVIEAHISGTMKDPKFKVSTDLANALSRAFNKAMGAELKKAQDAAKRKVDEALKPYKDKLDKLTRSSKAELDGKLKGAEDKVKKSGDKILGGLKKTKLF